MSNNASKTPPTQRKIFVVLDGLPVEMPAGRRTLTGIRSFLELLALEQQRVLFSLIVDGRAANLAQPLAITEEFSHVEAESIQLDQMSLQLLKTAEEQMYRAYNHVAAAVTGVLINEGDGARECWWRLVQELREPLSTLSLMPEKAYEHPPGSATLTQLRKWQLQQLATVIRDVDEACLADDPIVLSDAMEKRVLPWLEKLRGWIYLWRGSISAGSPLTRST